MVNFRNFPNFIFVWICCCIEPLICCQGTTQCNILAVLPSVWKSHYLFGRHLMRQLIEQRNCTVTIISAYSTKDTIKEEYKQNGKLQEILVEGLLNNWLEMGMSFDIDKIREKSILERFTRLMYASTMPVVVISPSGSNTWLHQIFGNPQNAALDPSSFLPYSENMHIWQRCLNTLMAVFEKLTYSFFHMIAQQVVYEKYFEPFCRELPHSKDLTENLSMALINTHPILQYPRAHLPNMLNIAGVHIKSDEDLYLPEILKDFIDGAPDGVIYMSLGANVYGFPIEKLDVFLHVFEALPELRFIIKYEAEEPMLLTKNATSQLLIHHWWPQQAILAHKNVKLFISTCGIMSTVEAIHFLKPILAMPIMPEQHVLANRLKNQGAASLLVYEEIAYNQLLILIREILTNISNYQENLKRLKHLLLADINGVSSIERTLNAIDLILDTQGGDFFKTHNHTLNFWRTALVDVLAILLVGFLIILAGPFLLIRYFLKRSYQNQTRFNDLKRSSSYHCSMLNDRLNINDINRQTVNRRPSSISQNGQEFFIDERRFCGSSTNLHQRRKRNSSNCSNSSSCCLCSSSSSSAPTTPSAKTTTTNVM
uniref:Glucuronosyltransferase n=1 Tax=Glossina austeni TaxID=7395 RepID=A0A1A9UP82_GLOAU